MIEIARESQIAPVKPKKRRLHIVKFYYRNQEPIQIWLSWRLVLFLLSILAGALIPSIWDPLPTTPGEIWSERLIGGWSRWDGEWYQKIATNGYWSDEPVAFYPLYPHLMRWLGWALTLGHPFPNMYLVTGLIISTVASFAMAIWLYKLARFEYDGEIARLTLTYFLLFPTAFFLIAVYTESLFLALAIGAFYAARTNRWGMALFLTALTVLTKNQGVFVAIALLVEYGQQREWNWRKLDRKLLYFGLPALAMGGWMLYNWLAFGNPLAFLSATQKYWYRYFSWPWATFRDGFSRLYGVDETGTSLALNHQDYDAQLLDIIVTSCFLILIPVVIRVTRRNKLRLTYAVFFAFCLFQPLSAPRSISILTSLPRYLIVIFPVFFLLAKAGRRFPFFHRAYFFIGLPLLGLLVARFTLGYWVA